MNNKYALATGYRLLSNTKHNKAQKIKKIVDFFKIINF